MDERLQNIMNALNSLLRFVERCRESGQLKCDDYGPEMLAREALSEARADAEQLFDVFPTRNHDA